MRIAREPPQTPTHLPCSCAPLDRPLDQPQHRRVQPVDLRRQLGVAAIHRQRVLGQVVGADGEEVHLRAPELIGQDAADGTSTMMPTWIGGTPSAGRSSARGSRLAARHSSSVAIIGNITCRSAGAGSPQDGAELRAEQLRPVRD